jgi:hypothetical protein
MAKQRKTFFERFLVAIFCTCQVVKIVVSYCTREAFAWEGFHIQIWQRVR